MNNIKKALHKKSIVLSLILLASVLSGCNDNKENQDETANIETSSETKATGSEASSNNPIEMIKKKLNDSKEKEKEGLTDAKLICTEKPELCGNLNSADGQCTNAREMMIIMRYRSSLHPSDENRYNEILAAQMAERCLTLVAGIEGTNKQDNRTKRLDALYEAISIIDQLQTQLEGSTEPIVLLYQWRYLSNRKSRDAFLKYEGTSKLETSELQYGLATLYASDEPAKALKILSHALELNKKADPNAFITARDLSQSSILMHIVTSLATLSYQQNKIEQAYIWTKISELMSISIATGNNFNRMFELDAAKEKELDQFSQYLFKLINTYQYTSKIMTPYE